MVWVRGSFFPCSGLETESDQISVAVGHFAFFAYLAHSFIDLLILYPYYASVLLN